MNNEAFLCSNYPEAVNNCRSTLGRFVIYLLNGDEVDK